MMSQSKEEIFSKEDYTLEYANGGLSIQETIQIIKYFKYIINIID